MKIGHVFINEWISGKQRIEVPRIAITFQTNYHWFAWDSMHFYHCESYLNWVFSSFFYDLYFLLHKLRKPFISQVGTSFLNNIDNSIPFVCQSFGNIPNSWYVFKATHEPKPFSHLSIPVSIYLVNAKTRSIPENIDDQTKQIRRIFSFFLKKTFIAWKKNPIKSWTSFFEF